MIFNRLFRKKQTNISSKLLEEKYLKVNNPSNVYGFQKKYYKQSDILLRTFGKARSSLINPVRFIIITDTHNSLKEEKLDGIIKEHPDYDLCILLGDHSDNDIRKVLNLVPKDKIYALLGNHDNDYITNYQLNSLNGHLIEVNHVKIMGIQGSFKYKPSNFPSFTQEDSLLFLKDAEEADILFSHDGPFRDSMMGDPAHQGLFGITYYLYKNHVPYNIHGHLHDEYQKTLLNGTCEICTFDIQYLELK